MSEELRRDEWYDSKLAKILRFLHNFPFEIDHAAQNVYDVFQILAAEKPELTYLDAFTIVERQIRVVRLETDRLKTCVDKLCDKLTPKVDFAARLTDKHYYNCVLCLYGGITKKAHEPMDADPKSLGLYYCWECLKSADSVVRQNCCTLKKGDKNGEGKEDSEPAKS